MQISKWYRIRLRLWAVLVLLQWWPNQAEVHGCGRGKFSFSYSGWPNRAEVHSQPWFAVGKVSSIEAELQATWRVDAKAHWRHSEGGGGLQQWEGVVPSYFPLVKRPLDENISVGFGEDYGWGSATLAVFSNKRKKRLKARWNSHIKYTSYLGPWLCDSLRVTHCINYIYKTQLHYIKKC